MTGRTHDLAAFTTLTAVVASQPLQEISLPTLLVAIGANFLGGLAPDLDQTTSNFWNHIRGGSFISRIITPLMGGHRFISHSIIGIFIFGFLVDKLLSFMGTFLIVDLSIVWWAFMLGFLSHLLMDTITRDGVPWLFPIPIKIGIPPLRALRVKTGSVVEKYLIFPGLLILNGLIYYYNYPKIIDFLKHYLH